MTEYKEFIDINRIAAEHEAEVYYGRHHDAQTRMRLLRILNQIMEAEAEHQEILLENVEP